MDYRREIDGLRALAVLPVIFFHAGFQTFSGGFVGVDVFFVISGYLITTITIAEKQSGLFSLAGFYERRARRILPALFVVLFACLPFAWLWLPPAELKGFSQSLIAVSGFASNILFWRTSGYFDTAVELKPLIHTWSLAVEEQYYLIYPVFLTLVWRLGRQWTLSLLLVIAALSLATAQWGSEHQPVAAFYLLPTRGWELLIGAFVAFYSTNQNIKLQPGKALSEVGGWIGLSLIAYAVFAFDKQTPVPGLFTLVPTIGAAFVILFATQETWIAKFLGNKFFVGMGLISYSAYLWHQPLFAFAKHRSFDEPGKQLLAALAIASVLLAYLTFRFIETPFRKKNVFNRQKIVAFGLLGSIFFVSTGLIGYFTKGDFFRRYDAAIAGFDASSNESGKNNGCWDLISKTHNLSDTCQFGAPDSIKSALIIGDSHAGAVVNELSKAVTPLKLSGYDYSYNACPPLYQGLASSQNPGQVACNGLRDDFFKRLQKQELPKTLILMSRWTILLEQDPFDNKEGGIETGGRAGWLAPDSERLGYVDALKKSYADSVRLMLDAGYKVILVYPVPEMGWDVPTRLKKIFSKNRSISADDASTSYQVFVYRNTRANAALDAIGEHANLVRVRPETILCNTFVKGRCAAVLDGVSLYYDDDHLSNAGARLIVSEVIKHLDQH